MTVLKTDEFDKRKQQNIITLVVLGNKARVAILNE